MAGSLCGHVPSSQEVREARNIIMGVRYNIMALERELRTQKEYYRMIEKQKCDTATRA